MDLDYDSFSKTMLAAMLEVMEYEDPQAVKEEFRNKGPEFDLIEDGGIDSLDLLDIMFLAAKADPRIRFPPGLNGSKMRDLHNAIREMSQTPAR